MTTNELSQTKWVIDPSHSEIAFKVKHLMITNVKGVFSEFEADITAPGNDFTKATINFRMNPASVNTGDAQRDAHLRSADFFDVENHKQVTFAVTSSKETDDEGNFEMHGDLTIKGISKPVVLNVEFGGVVKDPWGNNKAGFTITGKINRKDWGLNWNAALEAGGVLVGEIVNITCDIELTMQV